MNGIKTDPDVKMEFESITPSGSGFMDDDFYEDTGELQLPPKGVDKDIWLTRIPKWLYEAVSRWDDVALDGNDDEQIVLGEVLLLQSKDRPGSVDQKAPIRVFLSDTWQQHQLSKSKAGNLKLPSAFELNRTPHVNEQLDNTYIFTEKDLPGYKPSGLGYGRQGGGGSGGFGGISDPKARIQKRSKYRKAIPKHTALVGSSTREYSANPLPTPDFLAFEASRNRHAVQGANDKTNIINMINDHSASQSLQKMFKTFIKPAAAPKPQLNKAARIPKNELIDWLHKCFDQYAYWPMKALKAKTKQPEAYLKEVLVDIADLVKAGPFSSCWRRQDMYNRNTANQVLDVPPDAEGADDGDEELEMEDVV